MKNKSEKIWLFLCAIAFLCVMAKACEKEYVCDVIDSIPRQIYIQIIEENPSWDIDQIADYYMENRDLLLK
jgi:hypothetical protein